MKTRERKWLSIKIIWKVWYDTKLRCQFIFYTSFTNCPLWCKSRFCKGDFDNSSQNHLYVIYSEWNYRVIAVIFSNFFAVFEEAFSMFDVNASGKIQFKFLFPLLRNLGYNVHKAEAWDYLNELELAGKVTRNIDLDNNPSVKNFPHSNFSFLYYYI